MAKKQNPGLSEASQQIIQQIVVGLAEDFEVVTKEVTTQKIDMVATYKKNGSTIEIFYDATANLYGFQMFNHGCKTYEDINKFVQMLGIYMYINTEFMPTTQKLAQLYGQSEGINTKYQTFSGNKTDGFTAKYEIMSCDHYLFIQEKENSYLVSRVVLTDNGASYKTIDSLEYIKTNDGFEVRLTIPSLSNKLFDACLNNNMMLTREEFNLFVLKYDFLTITFEANITDTVEYHVTHINDKDTDFSFILEDYTDMSAFITAVLDRFNSKLPTDNVANNEFNPDNIDAVDIDDIEFDTPIGETIENRVISETPVQEEETDEEETDIEESEEPEESIEEPVEESDELEEPNEEPTNEESVEEVNNEMVEELEETKDNTGEIEPMKEETSSEISQTNIEDIAVRKINKDNELQALLFDATDKLYIVTVDKLEKFGIPFARITDVEPIIQKKGYTVLETESKRHIFAEDVSNNETIVKQLVTALF